MSAFDELVAGMQQGREWGLMGNADAVRGLLVEFTMSATTKAHTTGIDFSSE